MTNIYIKNRKLFLINFFNSRYFLKDLKSLTTFFFMWFCNRYFNKYLPKYFLGYRKIGAIPKIEWGNFDSFLYFPSLEVMKSGMGNISSYKLSDPHDIETTFYQNRFSFCISALLSDDIDLNVKSFKQVNDFLSLNPTCDPSKPRDETYSVCERLANFTFLMSSKGQINFDNLKCNYTNFYIQSTKLIINNLENYNSNRVNNHILNNARALVVSGVVLGSSEIVEYGLYIFHHYIPILFRKNGTLREGSTHYQIIIMNWLLDVIKFSSFIELSKKSKYYLDELLEVSLNAKWLTNFLVKNILDHQPLFIGDISPDLDPVTSASRLIILYPEFFTGSSIKNHCFQRIDDWIIFSDGRTQIISRVSSDNYPPKWPTHSHSDLTHIIWIFCGFPILIDAGRFSYKKDELSLTQISAAGHNVVLINSVGPIAESLTYGGYWCPSPYSTVTANCIIESNNSCEISHNGYCGIDNLDHHSRRINIHGDGITIYDVFSGYSHVEVNFLWNFPEGFQFKRITNCKYLLFSDKIQVELTFDFGENEGNKISIEFIPFKYSTQYSSNNNGNTLSLKIIDVMLPSNFSTNFRVISCAV